MEMENIVDESPQIINQFLFIYIFLEVYCFLMVDRFKKVYQNKEIVESIY